MKISIKHLFRLLSEHTSRRTLEYYAAQKILTPADFLLGSALAALKGTAHLGTFYPPIFIIGAPRSGSTLLYQYLSIVLEVSYVSSIWSVLPGSGQYLFPGKTLPPTDFNSFYGNSASIYGTHEGGQIFTQWFPDKEHHFTATLPESVEQKMRAYFETVSSIGKLPWLIKNGRNTLRIPVLRDVFPEAVYIRLNRNPIMVAQSIIEGRYRLTGSPDRNWTVMPKEWKNIKALPFPRQVARQVYYIESQVDEDLSKVPSERISNCDYDAFCAAPFDYALEICKRWRFVHLRPDLPLTIQNKTFTVSNEYRLSFDILDQMSDEFNNLTADFRCEKS